ncbi:MAG TPA: SRPBCC domain-containing protein [Thermoleophilaceae bacterium]|nr:SRPBCC domain-containing protein [Thermoleophilaceae bacterium]
MNVSGRSTVPMPPAELWAVLSDPARLGDALPHVDTVDVRDDANFSATVRVGTGLGQTPLRMEFEIADRREGEHVRIVGTGTAGENEVWMSVSLDLSSDDDGGSAASWNADVRIRGVLSSLLQRNLPAIVSDQIDGVLLVAQQAGSGSR